MGFPSVLAFPAVAALLTTEEIAISVGEHPQKNHLLMTAALVSAKMLKRCKASRKELNIFPGCKHLEPDQTVHSQAAEITGS